MAKMGLIAYPMQNSVRNMIGTLVFMCGGLIMSKLRILDGLWKRGFQSGGHSGLAGNSNHRFRFGGKFKSQICHKSDLPLLPGFLA